jgi:hypothetical protein
MNIMDIPQNLTSLYGNPDQMFSPSVYTNVTLRSIQQNLIRIYPNPTSTDLLIQGLLTSPFKIGVSAEWESAGILESITSNGLIGSLYGYATMIMGQSGMADPGSLGLSSQKIYKNSGYLEFDVSFRVIDWQGTGDPLLSAFVLSSMCLPTEMTSFNGVQLLNKIKSMGLTTIGKVIEWATTSLGMSKEHATQLSNAFTSDASGLITGTAKIIGKATEGALNWFPKEMGEAANKLASDPQFFVQASSPTPVQILIGTYFSRNDMIAKSVQTEFSKECSQAGPLYADFSISFSSRRALLISDSNLGGDKGASLGLMSSVPPRVTRGELATRYK